MHLVHKPTWLKSRYCTGSSLMSLCHLWRNQSPLVRNCQFCGSNLEHGVGHLQAHLTSV